MKFKKFSILLLLLFCFFSTSNIFAQTQNVGIIPSNIWYSEDPLLEGNNIKIYTVIYNTDQRELSGTVIFFDNEIFLGKKDFKLKAKSVQDVYIDWKVTSGSHTIFAKIENAKFLNSSGNFEEVYLADNKTEENNVIVSKKIITELPNNIVNGIKNTVQTSDIQTIIKENTPVFVTKTLDYTISSLEDLRSHVDIALDGKKNETKNEIDILNKIPENSISQTQKSIEKEDTLKSTFDTKYSVLRPFKYVELFFITIFSLIFKFKILFYILICLVIFFIIRYIWHLIF